MLRCWEQDGSTTECADVRTDQCKQQLLRCSEQDGSTTECADVRTDQCKQQPSKCHISEGLCSDATNQLLPFRCPTSPCNAMDNALEAHCDDLDKAISRLKLLSAHAMLSSSDPASVLQKSCTFFAASLVQITHGSYNLTSLRRVLSVITNTDLIDIQWIQASLLFSAGGLGGLPCCYTASSAFLAFAASTLDLQSQLQFNCHPSPDPYVDSAIRLWTSSHNIPMPDNTSAIKQHAWNAPIIAAD